MNGNALFLAVLLGSIIGFLVSLQIFGSGSGLRDNEFWAGLIMFGTMVATYFLVRGVVKRD